MRYRARRDANHAAIVNGLRAAGCSVADLSQLGGGVPDILCGYRGWDHLLEVKSENEKGKLSEGAKRSMVGQAAWADRWRGHPVAIVRSLEDALIAVGARAAIQGGPE